MVVFIVLFGLGPAISNIYQGTQKEPCLPLPWVIGLLTLVLAVNSEMAYDPAPAFLSHGLGTVSPACPGIEQETLCPCLQRQTH